jgi:hypothetical protein
MDFGTDGDYPFWDREIPGNFSYFNLFIDPIYSNAGKVEGDEVMLLVELTP